MQMPELKDEPIFQEIIKQSDRGAAVISAGFLEAKLKAAIASCLRDDKDTIQKLFKPSGPIGAFGSKIDLGYLLDLYGDETRKDLITISEIRNLFAHDHNPIDFGSRDIRKKCESLTTVARFLAIFDPPEPGYPRPLDQRAARLEYLHTVSIILNVLHIQATEPIHRGAAKMGASLKPGFLF